MKEEKREKGRFGTLMLGVSIMAILYGWFVYAGEIETNVDNNSQAIANSSTPKGLMPLDASAIELQKQNLNSIESQENASIAKDLFAVGKTMEPADAAITEYFANYSPQVTSDPLLQNGMMKFSAINAVTGYDDATAKAAQDAKQAIVYPASGPSVDTFPSSLNASTITSDPNMKAKFIQALSDEAVLSVARESFDEMIAKRTVPSSGQNAGSASIMQMMEQQATQRLMSTAWATALKAMPALVIQQDQAAMQAFQIWLEYQRYRQTERVEALLATLVLQNWRGAKALAQQLANQPTAQTAATVTQQAGGGAAPPATP